MTSKLSTLTTKYSNVFNNSPALHFECGDGWYNILDTLLTCIKAQLASWQATADAKEVIVAAGQPVPLWIVTYFKENPDDPAETFTVDQVKEKFGGLRFYYSGVESIRLSSGINGAISVAEMLSYRTCETCGNVGTCESVFNRKGWRHRETRCKAHHKAEAKNRDQVLQLNQEAHQRRVRDREQE